MNRGVFRAGATYDNCFLLFIDSAGYSRMVGSNPRNYAASAFDLLRDRVEERLALRAAEHGCARATLWSWHGDGGFLIVQDHNESAARDTALGTGRDLLDLDLPALVAELEASEFEGRLRLRIALHKGPLRIPEELGEETIHSPDINFAAHLEEVTPPDSLAISGEVHRISGRWAGLFEEVGEFEGHAVHLLRGAGDAGDEARLLWLRRRGLSGSTPVHAYPHRPSQREKARLVRSAGKDLLDLGSALNTCTSYLMTTERPALYRDAVLDFLARGGTYRCFLLDPDSEATALYSRLRQEDLVTKIKNSVSRFEQFKSRLGPAAEGLQVFQTTTFPGMSALCADLGSDRGLLLYSPYTFQITPAGGRVELADVPYYLAAAGETSVYPRLAEVIAGATSEEVVKRVL